MFLTVWIHYMCFSLIGKKILSELKWRYLKAILSQDQEWFDSKDLDSLPTEVNANLCEVEGSTGRVLSFLIFSAGNIVG